MAAMTTALTLFSNMGNTRTNALTGNTVLKPKLVVEKRKVASVSQQTSQYEFGILYGTEDSQGAVLDNRVGFKAVVTLPKEGVAADVTAALAIFRDIVAGDEFANSVSTLNFLKSV